MQTEPDKIEAEDYVYTPLGKRLDFLKGFFGNIAIGIIHFGLYWLLYFIFGIMGLGDSRLSGLVIALILLIFITIVEFKLIKHYFRTKRYIAIGLLSSLLLPLLVTGYCSIVVVSLLGG